MRAHPGGCGVFPAWAASLFATEKGGTPTVGGGVLTMQPLLMPHVVQKGGSIEYSPIRAGWGSSVDLFSCPKLPSVAPTVVVGLG